MRQGCSSVVGRSAREIKVQGSPSSFGWDVKPRPSLSAHTFKIMYGLKRIWMAKHNSRGPETHRYRRHKRAEVGSIIYSWPYKALSREPQYYANTHQTRLTRRHINASWPGLAKSVIEQTNRNQLCPYSFTALHSCTNRHTYIQIHMTHANG